MAAALELIALLLFSEVPLPGTQPNELALPPEPSSTCGCHDSFDATQISEPGESYRATMMALSGRDPLFRAALDVSYADRPDLSDLCIRCHVPVAWLKGRSEPSDGSLIEPEDLESVTCDMCHRAVPNDPALVGDGQYTLATSTAKRAPRGAAPTAGHTVVTDAYVSSPQLCALCHSLFNPAENAHDANRTELGIQYYEQRTYEEWVDSVFPGRDETCIDCHMSRVSGAAVRGGDAYSDLAVHNFVAGNSFALHAIELLNPNIGIAGLISQVDRWVEESLQRSAELAIDGTGPVSVTSGDAFEFGVRITNKTGHKLPTGYPEGRRVYLEVSLSLEDEPDQILSGEWDSNTGKLIRDAQLRAYETDHGRVENGTGTRIHHLILMNQILSDTRIPPEGFMPTYPDMVPQGRDYGSPPYRHWDDVTYTFPAPDVVGTKTGTITVRAMYQSTDGDVVDFLLGETEGTPEHDRLAMAWEMLDHAPPQQMVRASIPIVITERIDPPDAAISTMPDAGIPAKVDGGCSCVASRDRIDRQMLRFPFEWILLLAFALHLRQTRSIHHGFQTSRTSLSKERAGSAHLG